MTSHNETAKHTPVAAVPELLAALHKAEQQIEQLCGMVNSYAVQLRIMKPGKQKVCAEDWIELAGIRAAIAKATT